MTVTMNDSQFSNLTEIEDFLKGTNCVSFKRQKKNKREVYQWIGETLIKFKYIHLLKEDKGLIKKYLGKVSGYSRAQITRCIFQYASWGFVKVKEYKRHKFAKIYSDDEIKLLAETDEMHEFPNGYSVKAILKRMADVFHDIRFKHLSQISVTRIYNFRRSKIYQRLVHKYEKTKPVVRNIGERRKPEPNGKPGYLRVDSVHQGDNTNTTNAGETRKGVYHINIIDEVTQHEFVGSVEKISEAYLLPMLEKLISFFPFITIEFHADNGGEYINRQVAEMLNRLIMKLTKSRSRKTNDNALVESKNGSVIRKWIGYGFIEQKHADKINNFYFNYFNEYLNYHHPCAFAVLKEDKKKKGKFKKIYPKENYQTPYEKLKSLPNSNQYLKEGVSFKLLDKIAYRYSDNEMATLVQREREKLFNEILPMIVKNR